MTDAGDYYDVTAGSPFLDSTAFRYYRYQLLETPPSMDGADAPYYLLQCEPRTHAAHYLKRATIRIDRQSLCIQRIESEIPADLQRFTLNAGVPLLFTLHPTTLRKRLDYRDLQGRLYPSFARLERGWELTTPHRPVQHFEFVSVLMVNALGEAPTPFSAAEQYQGTLFRYGTHFAQPYWLSGNALPATTAEQAAIKRLATQATQ